MKKTVFALILAALTMAPAAYAEDSAKEVCTLEAKSNGLKGEEVDAYVKDCVEETQKIRSGEASEPAKAE